MEIIKPLSSVEQFAKTLGLNQKELEALASSAPSLYRVSRLPKPRGGFRVIEAPFKHLKEVQTKLLKFVLNRIPVHPILHGGPNTSTKSAAKIHIRQPVVITLDIQDFFPSVNAETVCRAFQMIGASKDIAGFVTRLVTRKKKLPQGAPTSSSIARIVLFDLCNELDTLLRSISPHARATIYVDDVTISGPIGLRRLVPTVVAIFQRHGYRLNRAKRKVMPAKEEQVVLGLRVNHSLELSSEFENKLEAERTQRHPRDPKLKGLESYRRFIIRSD